MPEFNMGGFHYYYQLLIAVLSAYATAQSEIDEELGFNVSKDYMRSFGSEDLPMVACYPPNITTNTDKSASKTHWNYECAFEIDLITQGLELDQVVDAANLKISADKRAVERLLMLEQQVIEAIYHLTQADFGQQPGEISVKSWPSIQTFVPGNQVQEEVVVGARLSFSIGISWKPGEPSRELLKEINLGGNKLDLNYLYNQEEIP